MTDSAIVLFAHGARDAQWAEPFRKIKAMVRARKPGMPVELAFLEIMQPSLDQAIAALVAKNIKTIGIIPLFMAQGGHLKEDLPRRLSEIKKLNPAISFRISPPIGEVEGILTAIADWICKEHDT
ncbi:MAG TPA: CbiX/SirB N-terminal domain-containing protein [Burkholderiales bacterium]|nr:CbiX/SirB N-terminal domain-containing protein [Burkholderiales bacterium]